MSGGDLAFDLVDVLAATSPGGLTALFARNWTTHVFSFEDFFRDVDFTELIYTPRGMIGSIGGVLECVK
ncbi:hypothetical protein GCM10009621_02710 [Corynebacterium felinum]